MQVGPYEVQGNASERPSGFGDTYIAVDKHGSRVLVKVLQQQHRFDATVIARFGRELEAGNRLTSQHFARVLDWDLRGDEPWIAFSFIEGRDLQDLALEAPLPFRRALRIADQLTAALVDLQAAGLVHRDLKPANVRIGPNDAITVLDLGIATAADWEAITSDQPATIAYASPEQLENQRPTSACDVWATALMLAKLTSGAHPFGAHFGSLAALIDAILHQEPDLGSVPDPWQPLLRACLSKEPTDRPTVTALRQAIQGILTRTATAEDLLSRAVRTYGGWGSDRLLVSLHAECVASERLDLADQVLTAAIDHSVEIHHQYGDSFGKPSLERYRAFSECAFLANNPDLGRDYLRKALDSLPADDLNRPRALAFAIEQLVGAGDHAEAERLAQQLVDATNLHYLERSFVLRWVIGYAPVFDINTNTELLTEVLQGSTSPHDGMFGRDFAPGVIDLYRREHSAEATMRWIDQSLAAMSPSGRDIRVAAHLALARHEAAGHPAAALEAAHHAWSILNSGRRSVWLDDLGIACTELFLRLGDTGLATESFETARRACAQTFSDTRTPAVALPALAYQLDRHEEATRLVRKLGTKIGRLEALRELHEAAVKANDLQRARKYATAYSKLAHDDTPLEVNTTRLPTEILAAMALERNELGEARVFQDEVWKELQGRPKSYRYETFPAATWKIWCELGDMATADTWLDRYLETLTTKDKPSNTCHHLLEIAVTASNYQALAPRAASLIRQATEIADKMPREDVRVPCQVEVAKALRATAAWPARPSTPKTS